MENFLHARLKRWIDLGVFDGGSVSSRSRGELRLDSNNSRVSLELLHWEEHDDFLQSYVGRSC